MATSLMRAAILPVCLLTAGLRAAAQEEKVRASALEFSRTSRILVHYRDVAGGAPEARRSAEANGLRVVGAYEPGGFLVCERGPQVAANALVLAAAVERIAASAAVEVVEPDPVITIPNPFVAGRGAAQRAMQAFASVAAASAASGRPNDPRLAELWGMANARALDAWACGRRTSPAVVAVIDTGIDYSHPDLSPNVWVNRGEIPGNGLDDDRNGYVDDVYGYDFANNDGDPADDNMHGTHCAGTIGAVGDNSRGVVGANWSVQIMALKFLKADGTGNLSDAVRCIDYARSNGAKVTSNSYRFLSSESGASVALREAIERARDAGIVFVAAAGNDSRLDNDGSFRAYPAAYPTENIISVAAIDTAEALADFSNIGARSVDLAAPGVDILSTVPEDQYTLLSGTSMATPHVAGAAALILGDRRFSGATWREVKAAILDHARPVASLSGVTLTGGTLDLRFLCEGGETAAPSGLVYAGANATATGAFVLNGAAGRAGYTYAGAFHAVELTFRGEGTSPDGFKGWVYTTSRPEPGEFLFTKAPASPAPYHRVYARPSGAGDAPFAWFMDAALYRLDAPSSATNDTGGLAPMRGSYRLGNPPGPTPSPAPEAGPVERRAYLVGYHEGRGDEVAALCKEYGLEVVERHEPGRFLRVRTTAGTRPDFRGHLSTRGDVRFVEDDLTVTLP